MTIVIIAAFIDERLIENRKRKPEKLIIPRVGCMPGDLFSCALCATMNFKFLVLIVRRANKRQSTQAAIVTTATANNTKAGYAKKDPNNLAMRDKTRMQTNVKQELVRRPLG